MLIRIFFHYQHTNNESYKMPKSILIRILIIFGLYPPHFPYQATNYFPKNQGIQTRFHIYYLKISQGSTGGGSVEVHDIKLLYPSPVFGDTKNEQSPNKVKSVLQTIIRCRILIEISFSPCGHGHPFAPFAMRKV